MASSLSLTTIRHISGYGELYSIEDSHLTRNNGLAGSKCKAARATLSMDADMFTHSVVLQTDESEKRRCTLVTNFERCL